MKRLDSLVVELGLAPSRSKAQQMIAAGEVEVCAANGEWKVITQVSFKTAAEVRVVAESTTLKYVSRGGLKLEGALQDFALDVRGWRCLDLGLSTGGFADCLLQKGAAHVTGYDVGHGQLNARLKNESKLKQFEGVNVRELRLSESFDLCTVDLSFISLKLVFPVLGEQLVSGTRLLALVKPQFEVGAENLGRAGVVQDVALFATVKTEILHVLEKCGFSTVDYRASQVKGQDGNQEFFVYAIRS